MGKLTPQEQRLADMYGGKVPKQADLLSKKFKDKKYFDSGDYAMSKSGYGKGVAVGSKIPSVQSIPQPSSPPQTSGRKGSIVPNSPPMARKMSSSSSSSSSVPSSPQQLGRPPQSPVYRKR